MSNKRAADAVTKKKDRRPDQKPEKPNGHWEVVCDGDSCRKVWVEDK